MIAGAAMALAAAAAAAGAVAASRPGQAADPPVVRFFPTAAEAVAAALDGAAEPPAVIAFGEVHQTTGTRAVPSALHRFTGELLPVLAPRLSHLVIETWISTGRCGEPERAVTADLERTTERPAETGNEIVDLIKAAAARQVAPRVLTISCADYAALQGGPGGVVDGAGGVVDSARGVVDYDRTLRMTARALEATILGALGARGAGGRAVAVYGGALHNDLYPEPSLAAYSFAPSALAATLGRYLEIDLVVPEFAAASAPLRAESWYRAYRRAYRPVHGASTVTLLQRSPRSYLVVFAPHATGAGRRRR